MRDNHPKRGGPEAPPDEDVRVLRPSELEFLKGGAPPGPTATPEPPSLTERSRDTKK